ncbi:adenosine/AMP deaminase family protein, putative (macronuclear) [Tetrahymena thermophila SB210]|uniref:Adenosine/AMP deaminase family protein, putative n=1 Tax=Tetrahymena thermophila (strain SB210) TaxID=312017 RepID=Q232U0_TETTS|nr:adenosine/AMP deaminase family protein, putative [Tetrahymena thermophila SB210]EAR91545.2 adenosine/AMP deaminase family protein, putative [Tetrahymena thermophila SB210]|eukprot:XP_001011790.2 adenosine/AMP deaminase family protein, putative [Tetrahymena thermophila SB210]
MNQSKNILDFDYITSNQNSCGSATSRIIILEVLMEKNTGQKIIRIYHCIRAAISSQPYDSEIILVVSVQVYLEDASVGKVTTEKYFYNYFLTKQKYVDPNNFQSAIDANQDVLNHFAQNVKENKKRLNYIKDNKGFNPGNLDPYIRGFVY